MLRITVQVNTGTQARLRVEGRLIGPWIKELESAVIGSRSAGESVCLDLSGLRFADDEGLDLLRRLVGEKVILERISPFLRELLDLRPE